MLSRLGGLASAAKFHVVDGQHRVLALVKLIEEDPERWCHFQIPYVCLLGATEEEEMEQFYIVNSTAKSVKTDLALALLKQRAEKDPSVYEALQERGRDWMVDGQAIRAMNPVTYTASPELFASRQAQLDSVLAFCGMAVGDDGKVRHAAQATDLEDAIARADRLHKTLATRKVHIDVLEFCRAELLQKNYFHAVFEAMKSIAAKIRALSGLTSDGAELVRQAFGMPSDKSPRLAINELRTETDRGEQRGFANLLIGLFGTIRNPTAHNPRIEWDMSEQDALDILTTASLIHRKLDKARRM